MLAKWRELERTATTLGLSIDIDAGSPSRKSAKQHLQEASDEDKKKKKVREGLGTFDLMEAVARRSRPYAKKMQRVFERHEVLVQMGSDAYVLEDALKRAGCAHGK